MTFCNDFRIKLHAKLQKNSGTDIVQKSKKC